MREINTLSRAAFAAAMFCITAGTAYRANAQSVSIYTASYTSAGSAAQTSGTFTLNTFTVTGVYSAGSTTTTTLFISDGTANGRIFGSPTALASLATVGAQGTVSITDSVYQGTEEFKTPTAVTAAGTTGTVTPISGMLSQVAATVGGAANAFTSGPGDSLYASEGALLFAPVTFTITPNTTGTLLTTGATTLTDTATGDTVILYKPTTAFGYTAGTPLTVTGYEQPYNGSGTQESEIVGAFSATSTVPEPSTEAMLGLGGIALAACVWRRIGRRIPAA